MYFLFRFAPLIQKTMKRKLLILLTLLLITASSYGQFVVLKDSTDLNNLIINECGTPDTITTYIRVAGTPIAGNTVLVDSFPSQFVVTGFILNPAITLFQGIGTNQAAIKINPAILNANPLGIKLRYLVSVKCGANGISTARHKFKFTNAAVNVTSNAQDIVSAIKAPVLLVESFGIIDRPDAVSNSSYTRYWRIRNTGTNSTINQFTFAVKYQDGLKPDKLEVDGVLVTPTVIGDSIYYTINKTLREFSKFKGDTVVVEETYRVAACSEFSLFSKIYAQWGCYTSPVCKRIRKFAATQIPGTVPNVRVKLLT